MSTAERRLCWRCTQNRLPFFKCARRVFVPGEQAVVVGPNYLMEWEFAFAIKPKREPDIVGVVAGIDLDVVAFHVNEEVAIARVGWAVQFDVVGEGLEHRVGGRARSTYHDEFGVVPGFVEADGERPWRATIIFNDVHRVPTVFGNVI